MSNVLDKIIDLVSELQVISEENSLSVDVGRFGEKHVHFKDTDIFFGMFDHFEEEVLKGAYEFPYRLKVEVEDIEFFTLLNQADYESYVTKTK